MRELRGASAYRVGNPTGEPKCRGAGRGSRASRGGLASVPQEAGEGS